MQQEGLLYKYMNGKRMIGENVFLLLKAAGDQVTQNTENAKVLNTFF